MKNSIEREDEIMEGTSKKERQNKEKEEWKVCKNRRKGSDRKKRKIME